MFSTWGARPSPPHICPLSSHLLPPEHIPLTGLPRPARGAADRLLGTRLSPAATGAWQRATHSVRGS